MLHFCIHMLTHVYFIFGLRSIDIYYNLCLAPFDVTKYIKTCTELSHPGCLLLQFYALNHVFIIYILRCNLSINCLTLVCSTDLHVHLLKNHFIQ